MKRNLLVLAFAAVLTVLASCSKDDSKIWDAIEDLRDRVTALEKTVADNVSALQSMISLGSVASWETDALTGKGVITLVDGRRITIDQSVKGYSLITVVEGDDGVWYWAVCKDGVSSPLEIGGKKVPVAVTPALKISDDNEWLISADGGKTWVATGVKYQGTSQEDGAQVVFFKDVKQENGHLVITLADGTVIKVAVSGEASFIASADTLWFSRAEMEKSVAVEMTGVKAYTITEKPEGWVARMDDGYLYVTSPDDFESFPQQGTVKALAVFDTAPTPAIISLEVVYEPMFTLSYVNGKISVKMSEHTAEDFNGYVLAGWKKSEFTSDRALEWLNSEAASLVPFAGTAEYALSDIVAGYSAEEDYVIFASPYLPAMQVTQGKMEYVADDITSIEVAGSGSAWTITEVRFDSAVLQAEMDVPFYGGFFKLDDWNNYGRDNFLEILETGGAEPYAMTSYDGPANGFPDGKIDIDINPATEYVVWYLPENEAGIYTADSFITYTFITPDVSPDTSVPAPAYVTRDVTASGFTADVTPASGTYRTYAAIVKKSVMPETDKELVRYLIDVNISSSGQSVNTVTNYSMGPGDEVYLVAVSVTENGGYGALVKEKVALAELTFSDDLGVEVTDIAYGLGDVTLSLGFKGNPESITYIASTYNYYEDDVMERLMALGQIGEATNVKVASLDGKIYLDQLLLGAEHTFYAVVSDAAGNSSRLYKYVFIPRNDIDYITSDMEGYEYGMPQLSGTCTSSASYTLTLSVDMPSTCRKYWLFRGNYEYFTGDLWTDSDKLVTQQYSDVTVHESSVSGLKYTFMNSTSRIYMVWQDDNGGFHAIYEYNPKK